MAKRLIRSDEFGLYVRTGGYSFRPLPVAKQEFFPTDPLYAQSPAVALATGASDEESQLQAGQHVNATHVGGTTTAKVGDELWVSSSVDPRYTEYVDRGPGVSVHG